MIMLRARTEPEFQQMSGRTKAPLATLASWTVKSPPEMTAAGYSLVLDPNSVTILTYLALSKGFAALKTDPWYGLPRTEVLAARAEVQELIGLEASTPSKRDHGEGDAGQAGRQAHCNITASVATRR
jgi:hypothetical protein